MFEIIKSENNNNNIVNSVFNVFLANIPEKIQNIEFSVRVKTVAGNIFKKSVKAFSNGSLHIKG